MDGLHTLRSIKSPNPFQLLRVLKDNADLTIKDQKIIELSRGIEAQQEQIETADRKMENIQKNFLEVV